MFCEKLDRAMLEKGMNITELAAATGIGKSSLSQYRNGKHEPDNIKKIKIAKALGLESGYFLKETAPDKSRNLIKKLLVDEAARLMGVSSGTVKEGLKDKRFPWGYAIHTSENHWTFWINAKKFAKIEGITIDEINEIFEKGWEKL